MYAINFSSPLGPLYIMEEEGLLTELGFGEAPCGVEERDTEVLSEAREQLEAYFAGTRKAFSLPLSVSGTAFQCKVWEALQSIPYGETRSYQDIALQVGNVQAVRAVGGANHKNRIAILIPCHRVIGKNGKLVGYAGGMEYKQALLELEKRYV